jgi:hypothetical protein
LEAEPEAVPALATYLANAKRGTSLNKFESIYSQLNIIYTAEINLLLLFVWIFVLTLFLIKFKLTINQVLRTKIEKSLGNH